MDDLFGQAAAGRRNRADAAAQAAVLMQGNKGSGPRLPQCLRQILRRLQNVPVPDPAGQGLPGQAHIGVFLLGQTGSLVGLLLFILIQEVPLCVRTADVIDDNAVADAEGVLMAQHMRRDIRTVKRARHHDE